MRLTELYTYRNADDFICSDFVLINKDADDYDDAIQKLGQLEDIEEELGIDLVTLFKALKHGIYVKNRKNEIRRVNCNIGLVETGGHDSLGLRFQDTNYKWRYLVLDTSRDNDVKDYDKTWALTKEELL